MPVLEITQAADVGMGSFYNHFESKEQLFDAAVADVLDAHGALLDRLTAVDRRPRRDLRVQLPAHRPAVPPRPQESQILLAQRHRRWPLGPGSAPRALRDIEAATRAGRFTVDDPELALTVVAGARSRLGNLLRNQPDRDDAQATDPVTEDVLRMFGCPPTRRARSAAARYPTSTTRPIRTDHAKFDQS